MNKSENHLSKTASKSKPISSFKKPRPAGWVPGKNQVDLARTVVYEVLSTVKNDEVYANLYLPEALTRAGLSGRDAAFATQLTYGVLRHEGLLREIIAQGLKTGTFSALDLPVQLLSLMGAYQLLFMRVGAHAAVNETVNQMRNIATQGPARLVNALLRRVSEKSLLEHIESLLDSAAYQSPDIFSRLALLYSTPKWQVKALAETLSAVTKTKSVIVAPQVIPAQVTKALIAENATQLAALELAPLEHLLATNLLPAQNCLAVKPGILSVRDLQAALPDFMRKGSQIGKYSPWALYLENGKPGKIQQVRNSLAAVQDEGSQIVVAAFIGALLETGQITKQQLEFLTNPTKSKNFSKSKSAKSTQPIAWLDMCAGPGGKAGLLAAVAVHCGIEFVANELQPHRSRLVAEHLRPILADPRAQDLIHLWCSDGSTIGQEYPQDFDAILLDTPCSGLGTLRRRAEARWRKQPQDIAQLRPVQISLLESAYTALAPGGILAYSTCSPHLLETRTAVETIRKRHPDLELLDAPAAAQRVLKKPLEMPSAPYLYLWPHVHGTDAMFLALLRKPLKPTTTKSQTDC